MKALLTASFDERALARLEKIMPVHVEDWRKTKNIYFEADKMIALLREHECDHIIVEADFVQREVIEAVDLKFIGSCRGAPVNIDIAAATEKKIPVLNTPARNADAVADLTLCFMLTLARHTYDAIAFVKGGKSHFGGAGDFLNMYEAMTGVEIYGRTVGLVGFGAIGQRVAKRVRGFDGEVVAYDPYQDDSVFEEFGARKAELDDVLREADFLSVHVPDIEATKGMIGAREIGLLKPGAFFINTARAAAVEEEPLFEACRSGHIRGAALDVFWAGQEPVRSDNRFVELPNVIATPHIGGATHDVVTHQGDVMVEGLEAWLRGDRPRYLVNPEIMG